MQGNVEILEFLIKQLKERDLLFDERFIKYTNLIEYSNKDSMTPVIIAAKYNNFNCVISIVEDGANIHAVDNKM